MQYETINRRLRARELRHDARVNHAAGYPGFAEVAWESAEWLDPQPREKKPSRRGRS